MNDPTLAQWLTSQCVDRGLGVPPGSYREPEQIFQWMWSQVADRRMETCRRKVRYEAWEDARVAGLAVSQENPRPKDANAPTPYRCDVIEPAHYHCGHIGRGNTA